MSDPYVFLAFVRRMKEDTTRHVTASRHLCHVTQERIRDTRILLEQMGPQIEANQHFLHLFLQTHPKPERD